MADCFFHTRGLRTLEIPGGGGGGGGGGDLGLN